ncbi:hypothetical protein BKA80DRAFT_286029 [Phyllosticta citrichinensis]
MNRRDGRRHRGLTGRRVAGSSPGQYDGVPLGRRSVVTVVRGAMSLQGRAIKMGSRRGQVPAMAAEAGERRMMTAGRVEAQVRRRKERGASMGARRRQVLGGGRKLDDGGRRLQLWLRGDRDRDWSSCSSGSIRVAVLVSGRGRGDRACLDRERLGAPRRGGDGRDEGLRNWVLGDGGGLESHNFSRRWTVTTDPARARVARAHVGHGGRRSDGLGGAHSVRAQGHSRTSDRDVLRDGRGNTVASQGLLGEGGSRQKGNAEPFFENHGERVCSWLKEGMGQKREKRESDGKERTTLRVQGTKDRNTASDVPERWWREEKKRERLRSAPHNCEADIPTAPPAPHN